MGWLTSEEAHTPLSFRRYKPKLDAVDEVKPKRKHSNPEHRPVNEDEADEKLASVDHSTLEREAEEVQLAVAISKSILPVVPVKNRNFGLALKSTQLSHYDRGISPVESHLDEWGGRHQRYAQPQPAHTPNAL